MEGFRSLTKGRSRFRNLSVYDTSRNHGRKIFSGFDETVRRCFALSGQEETKMPGMQGKRFTEEQVSRVKYLLAKTEMTIHEIALRTGSSESTIATINRRFDIRRYNGKRAQWEMGTALVVESPIRVASAPSHTAFRGEIQYRSQIQTLHLELPAIPHKGS
jgi:hypothetical protein